MGIIALIAHTDVSVPVMANWLKCIFMGGPHFVFSLGTTWPSNAATNKNQVG
jgi:hypothetical protein